MVYSEKCRVCLYFYIKARFGRKTEFCCQRELPLIASCGHRVIDPEKVRHMKLVNTPVAAPDPLDDIDLILGDEEKEKGPCCVCGKVDSDRWDLGKNFTVTFLCDGCKRGGV